jgi:hypothetical protein
VGEGRTGVGRDEEDFVIIASEGEESKECSCTLEGSQEAAKVSTTTAAGGILKTAQDRLVSVLHIIQGDVVLRQSMEPLNHQPS